MVPGMTAASRRDAGYTLVEILVVCLIAGVLFAIAIPTFLNQREKGYRTTVVADMRTLVLAQASRAVDGEPVYTDDVNDLKDRGFMQSSAVDAVHVELFDEDGPQYVACLKHSSLDEWLVFSSVSRETTYSSTQCSAT